MRRGPGAARRLAHLVKAADFERVLRIRQRAATAHFAVHHLLAPAGTLAESPSSPSPEKLSTNPAPTRTLAVDDLPSSDPGEGRSWVGAVVPKRHARRAVTRSLIRRQIYAAAERHRPRMAPGLWIVRLRSPLDRAEFPSAASTALRRHARAELDALFAAALSRPAAP